MTFFCLTESPPRGFTAAERDLKYIPLLSAELCHYAQSQLRSEDVTGDRCVCLPRAAAVRVLKTRWPDFAAVRRRQEKVRLASHVGKGSVGLNCPAHDLYDRARVRKQVGNIIFKCSVDREVEMKHVFML